MIGDRWRLAFLYSGVKLGLPFRPQLLYELKMDGAIIVNADLSRLARTSS